MRPGYYEPEVQKLKPVRKPRGKDRPSRALPNEKPGECIDCAQVRLDPIGWFCLPEKKELHREAKACVNFIDRFEAMGLADSAPGAPVPTISEADEATDPEGPADPSAATHETSPPEAASPPPEVGTWPVNEDNEPPSPGATQGPPEPAPLPVAASPKTDDPDAFFDMSPPELPPNEMRTMIMQLSLQCLESDRCKKDFPALIARYSTNGKANGIPDTKLSAAIAEINALLRGGGV